MRYTYTADCHSHTVFSPDGSDAPGEMYRKAAELGMDYYTVTDHCECNEYTGTEGSRASFKDIPPFNFRKQSAAGLAVLAELQKTRAGKTKLLKGVELGQPMQNLPAAEEVAARGYDFVLASLHNIGGFDDFYYLEYDKMESGYIDAILTKYFEELFEMVKWGKFDALSHLTYPVRYIRKPEGSPDPMDAHMDEIEGILQAVIAAGKAIELNTSGFFYMGETQPNQEILNLYHGMGGKYVTIGSDSHRMQDVGRGIEMGLGMLEKAGFDAFTVYVNHEPLLLPIQRT